MPAPELPAHHLHLLTVLRDLAAMMAGPTTIEGILKQAGDRCAEVLPADAVGVLLHDDWGGLVVATASDGLGRVVEDLEVELGEGPCSQSMGTGALIAVPDLHAAVEDYPRFVPRALELGARSVHAVPMVHQRQHVGSMDIIAREPIALDAPQLGIAQLLADVAMSYIANSRLLEEATTTAMHLQRALDSRVAIEQAKGALAERHGITPIEAFERMRAHARSNRIRLSDVAADVIDGRLRL